MSAQPWLTSEQASSWRTVSTERVVLVVVHNLTAATRLFDLLPLWSGDSRLQTVFTCIGSSAFTAGTEEFLQGLDMPTIPWSEAVRAKFDLAISASHGGPLHELAADLIIVPHGMGYNKKLEREAGKPGSREAGKPVFGLSGPWLLHEGELIPSVLVLSHSEQLDRLRENCPEAVGIAEIAGDPCLDRILASRALRATYREALGVRSGQKLVLVSSTWGEESLYGNDPELPLRLARQLPADEYRIVMALHPNIWQGHSSWQLHRWLAACTRAGVLVLPPEEGWRAAIIAADLTIGDHGSVTFYSTALDNPLLLATAPEYTVDEDSPIAQLLRVAPKLHSGQPLLPQVEKAITDHAPGRYGAITELATDFPGQAAELLTKVIYERLDLDEPEPAETIAVPVPKSPPPGSGSQLVQAELTETGARIRRFPADAINERTPPTGTILVTDTNEPTRRWLELAEIICHHGPHSEPDRWIAETLAAMPGCLLAITREASGSWLIGDGESLRVRVSGPERYATAYAALVHTWLVSGRVPEESPELQFGSLSIRPRIRSASEPNP